MMFFRIEDDHIQCVHHIVVSVIVHIVVSVDDHTETFRYTVGVVDDHIAVFHHVMEALHTETFHHIVNAHYIMGVAVFHTGVFRRS